MADGRITCCVVRMHFAFMDIKIIAVQVIWLSHS